MKFPTCSIVLLCLFVLPGCKTRDHSATAASSPFLQLPEGEYLSDSYIDTLKRTRSAFEAGKTGEESLIGVERKGKQVQMEIILNFHEGGAIFAVNDNGSVVPVEDAGEDMNNWRATVVNGGSFILDFGQSRQVRYNFVKTAVNYVSGVILAGKYRDSRGHGYEFRQDGWATFPEGNFKYEIGLDHVLNAFDYYYIAKGKMWGFRRNGNQLQIFATTDPNNGPEEIVPGPPLLSLRPIN